MTLQQKLDHVNLQSLYELTFQSVTGTEYITVQFYSSLNELLGGSQTLAVNTSASSLLYLYAQATGQSLPYSFPAGSAALTFNASGNVYVGYAGRRDAFINPTGCPTTILATGTGLRLGPRTDSHRGQQPSAESIPVVLPTDQEVNIENVNVAGTIGVSGTVTSQQGGAPWTVNVNNTAAVSGTVTAVQGGAAWNTVVVSGAINAKTVSSSGGMATATFDAVAAVATKRIKVSAYSLVCSGNTGVQVTFKSNGSGGTTLWGPLPLKAADGTSLFGANLGVGDPGCLFGTVAGEKLTIVLDAAVPVYWSISYFTNDST